MSISLLRGEGGCCTKLFNVRDCRNNGWFSGTHDNLIFLDAAQSGKEAKRLYPKNYTVDASGRLIRAISPQVLTSTSTVVFQIFACDDQAVEGESYLRADYSLSCNSSGRMWYQIYAGVMILVSDQQGPGLGLEFAIPRDQLLVDTPHLVKKTCALHASFAFDSCRKPLPRPWSAPL